MNAIRHPIRNTLLTLVVVSAFIIDAARAAQPAGPLQMDNHHRDIAQVDASRVDAVHPAGHADAY